MALTPEAIDDLIKRSQEAEKFAYAKYSNFPVGAALLCKDGKVYTGCNVENAAYGLAFCAERTAMVKAVSEGNRAFKAIAITAAHAKDYIYPCGSCRQFMAEFGIEWTVFMTNHEGQYIEVTVGDLLPYPFLPNKLP